MEQKDVVLIADRLYKMFLILGCYFDEYTVYFRGGAREESESHINLDRMPADGNSESVTEEERLIMQGSSLISLNDLSSTIEKETVCSYELFS